MQKRVYVLSWILLFSATLIAQHQQQTSNLIGSCEGCEAVFEFGRKKLKATDTLPDFNSQSQRIKIYGVVYKQDGKTPAGDVILYVYHTDHEGVYPKKGTETGWGRRHGYIRGWMKTDRDGRYAFYTFKPASYPSRTDPAHIHLTILEPDGKYYYVADYFFEDDVLLKAKDRNPATARGGLGILSFRKEGGLQVGERNIFLGKNIAGYK